MRETNIPIFFPEFFRINSSLINNILVIPRARLSNRGFGSDRGEIKPVPSSNRQFREVVIG